MFCFLPIPVPLLSSPSLSPAPHPSSSLRFPLNPLTIPHSPLHPVIPSLPLSFFTPSLPPHSLYPLALHPSPLQPLFLFNPLLLYPLTPSSLPLPPLPHSQLLQKQNKLQVAFGKRESQIKDLEEQVSSLKGRNNIRDIRSI